VSGAIVVGGSANGLTIARSLAAAGIRPMVIVTRADDIAQHSRACAEAIALPGFTSDPAKLIELLDARVDRWRGFAVYPTDDHGLTALAASRGPLARSYRLMLPEGEGWRRLLDKGSLAELAAAVGVPTPRIYGDAAPAVSQEAIDFPVVVKPSESHLFRERFGHKLFVAADRGQLVRAVARFAEAGLSGLVQDLVPGRDSQFHNCAVYLGRRGQLAAAIPMHKLRKSPPSFGVCRVAELGDRAELIEPTVELLRHVGFTGMANAEYKLDPRCGTMRLIEVNLRPFLMAGLARRGGVDLPLLAWSEIVEGELPRVRANGWPGVWIDLCADAVFALTARRAEGLTLRDYAAPYRRPKSFAVWSRADPMPFLHRLRLTLGDGIRFATSPSVRSSHRARISQSP
jgi:D-aspartate ligase